MPILRVNQKNVLFVHIPKTGGATVERYLGQLGKLGFFLGGANQPFYRCTPQHFDADMLAPLFPPSFIDYRFAFVRHPLDRIVSEYKMRVGRRFKDGRDFPSFEVWFDRFEEKLSNDSHILDNHLNQQISFICENTKVFRFENGITKNLEQVQIDLGVTFDFSQNFHAQRTYEGIVVDVPSRSITKICDIYAPDFEKFGYEVGEARHLA